MKRSQNGAQESWPPLLSPERKIEQELGELRQVYEEETSTPEKALALLKEAGILDAKGDLAEPYR